MKVKEFKNSLKEMTDQELAKEEKDLKSELFKLRFQVVTNQLENPLKLREVRRSIARVKTVIKDRQVKLNKDGNLNSTKNNDIKIKEK